VIECTKINLSEQAFSSIIVVIASAKGCGNRYRTTFFRG